VTSHIDWLKRANCRDEDPELFWPSETDVAGQEAALAICALCPVQAECLALARQLRAQDGVWGGKYRGKIESRTRRPMPACGTPSGYRRHLRLKEATCEPCRLAHNAASARSYKRIKGQPKCQKLNADEVRAIREASAAGQSTRSLASSYGLSCSQINKIIRRLMWVNV
jgi:hypothetical protein